MNSIPIIDLKELQFCSLHNNPETWNNIAGQIRKALSGIGFMYLKNHGISEETIANAFQASSQFFNLSESEKSKYLKDPNVSTHGWVKAGQELLHPNSVFELRECFDVAGSNRKYPSQIQFKEAVEKLENEGNELIVKLLMLLGLSLDLEDVDFFLKCCRHLNNPEIESECDLRLIHYPAISENLQIPPGTVRCAEHTDYEILTLLFQDDVGGLEVKNVEGSWIPAPPVENAILVNTGDLLEFWTEGFYPATFHRVVIPEKEIQKRVPRYSIAYFFAPDNNTVIGPLNYKFNASDGKVKDVESCPPITAYEHIMRRVKAAYQY